MIQPSKNKPEPAEDTGVADVRLVREKIAAQYNGDIKMHVAQTTKMIQPLIETLGLKQGIPSRRDGRPSGTAG